MKDNPLEIFKINRQKLKDNHVYNEKYEHDNCGVGLVASINGESRRDIVEKELRHLKQYSIEVRLMLMAKLEMVLVLC